MLKRGVARRSFPVTLRVFISDSYVKLPLGGANGSNSTADASNQTQTNGSGGWTGMDAALALVGNGSRAAGVGAGQVVLACGAAALPCAGAAGQWDTAAGSAPAARWSACFCIPQCFCAGKGTAGGNGTNASVGPNASLAPAYVLLLGLNRTQTIHFAKIVAWGGIKPPSGYASWTAAKAAAAAKKTAAVANDTAVAAAANDTAAAAAAAATFPAATTHAKNLGQLPVFHLDGDPPTLAFIGAGVVPPRLITHPHFIFNIHGLPEVPLLHPCLDRRLGGPASSAVLSPGSEGYSPLGLGGSKKRRKSESD